jgi:hypothetical protein
MLRSHNLRTAMWADEVIKRHILPEISKHTSGLAGWYKPRCRNGGEPRVRMGLHTGEAAVTDDHGLPCGHCRGAHEDLAGRRRRGSIQHPAAAATARSWDRATNFLAGTAPASLDISGKPFQV